MTVKKKLEIFEKVNRGEVRVILGSTFTLGTGVNIQERLHTLIHLMRPTVLWTIPSATDAFCDREICIRT